MFLLDNILLAPGRALMFLLEEMGRKATEDFLDDDSVKEQLQEIYALLDSGKISGSEFDSREHQLLMRLEQIANAKFGNSWGAPADPTKQLDAFIPPAEDETVSGQPFIDVIESRPLAVDSVGVSPGIARQAPTVEDRPEPLTPNLNMLDVVRRLLESPRSAPPPAERDNRESAEALRDQENLERIMRWREQKQPAQTAAPVAPPPPIFVAPPLPPSVAALPPTFAAPPLVAPLTPPVTYAAASFERQAVPVTNSLTMSQVIECTVRGLSLLKLKVSTVSSVNRDENGWRVTAELVERRSVPDTSDLLGVYELRLDEAGNILSYERTRIRRRSDLGRS